MSKVLMTALKTLLQKLINDIDSGNSNMSEEEIQEVIDKLKEYTRKDVPLSKYQAYTYLNMSRAKFDNLVKEGRLPKGQKVAGFKELRWYKRDLKI